MKEIIYKVLHEPMHFIRLIMAVLRGCYYIILYRIVFRNVTIKFPLIAFARLKIEGPGRVYIGSRCVIAENVFKGLSITTLDPSAYVMIEGHGCMLAGLTIRCKNSVSIGSGTMTAISLIQDYDYLPCEKADILKSNHCLSAGAIKLGNNVWLGGMTSVLNDVNLGDDCVVSAGAVLHECKMDDYNLCTGNPVKRGISIEKLMEMRNRNA